jgi:hypothetical protein
MHIEYARESSINVDEVIEVLCRSGLGERRPVSDRDRIRRMIENSNLIVSARCGAPSRTSHTVVICRILQSIGNTRDRGLESD